MSRARNGALWSTVPKMLPAQPFISGEPNDPATQFFNLVTEDGELLLTEASEELIVEEAFFTATTDHGGGRFHS